MRRRFLFIAFLLIVLCGCTKQENIEKPISNPVDEVEVEQYVDYNQTPIGFYQLEGNKLTRLHEIHKSLEIEEDVGLFQVYPSLDEEIYLDKAYGPAFYQEWIHYSPENTVKIGFHIQFKKNNGELVSYNILSPSQTFDKWEYLMNYLYDDYANFGKYFYSHIENEDYHEDTLFTGFKMQSSYQCNEIASAIELSVFTYDSADDIDENGIYRGNSSHTFMICVDGYGC